MASEFDTCRLSELVAEKPRNGLYKSQEFQGTGKRWVKMAALYTHRQILNQEMERVEVTDDETQKYGCLPGDLLFGRTSVVAEGVGTCSIVGEIADAPIFESNLFRIRLDESKALPRFYFYYFRSPAGRSNVMTIVRQTAAAQITSRDLLTLDVPHPPLEIQERISQILGVLDDKIELNQQMNVTLEGIARAFFKSWFVDFDPVREKMDGKKPLSTNDATAARFPSELEHSDLGLIPSGWTQSIVRNEFDLTMGQSPPGRTYNEVGNGTPFFQGRRDFGFRFPNRRVFCTAPTRFAKSHDTLVSVRAPVGDINMARESCCIGRGVAAVLHKSQSRSYTYYSMMSLADDFARYEAEGTVFGSISKKNFESLEVMKPASGIVQAFEKLVSPIDSKIDNLTCQSETLAEVRDALLPRLLSGEICVLAAQREVEAIC